ncbi:helix-turn-helix domain-containing protein [Tamlana sp. 2201CG12-4]|uniref:helix-turn-helix domain-containing protein n=1 Tax=Tamlana sp. 2201CG12-4 TaxID=3112582 RepID=UPI002DB5E2F9|nr:helix-turn-helix domain-containing protein [Tamlana sp. 2201CG12-4]MEC3906730.1 helix-turn-helix domain-containing protein [Tamlana sp. 2201CG12-4]
MAKLHLKGFLESLDFYCYEKLMYEILCDFNSSRGIELKLPENDDVFNKSVYDKLKIFKTYFNSRIKIVNTEKGIVYKSRIIGYKNENRSILKAIEEIKSGFSQISLWKYKVDEGNYQVLKSDNKEHNTFFLLRYELYFDYLKLNKAVLIDLEGFLNKSYAEQLGILKSENVDSKVYLRDVETEANKDEKSNLLTINDACDLLGKSRSTLHVWTEKGYLKKHIIGGSVYYFRDELLKKINGA